MKIEGAGTAEARTRWRGMELVETSNLCTKSYHSGTVPDFAWWYRILQFDTLARFMAQAESKNSIQVIERVTRLLDALAAMASDRP